MAKKEKEEERRSVLDSIGDFFGDLGRNIANDIAVGVGAKPATPGHRLRTAKTIARNKANEAYYGSNNDNSSLAQSNRAAAQRAAMSAAAAPALPNADGVGATEQALLDANKKGRSSTIATSAAGLLAGEDSTRKKRSLMGGLIR